MNHEFTPFKIFMALAAPSVLDNFSSFTVTGDFPAELI